MTTHNASNERIKRKYFAYLKEAMRHSEPTVDAVAKALNRFEVYTRHRDFKAFHFEQAVGFKKYLAEQKAKLSGEKLSKATLHATLNQLKQFFQWLSRETGYKSRIQYSDAEYFNLSEKDTRIATAKREQRSPTMAQIKHVIASMPTNTVIERRNRALIAFTLPCASHHWRRISGTSRPANRRGKHLIHRCWACIGARRITCFTTASWATGGHKAVMC